MAIIDRDPAVPSAAELERIAALDPSPGGRTAMPSHQPEPASAPAGADALSGPGRVLLASLSAAAGAVHLVMVPSHARLWVAEGVAFALAGWLQIGLALLLVTRPSKAALRVSSLANVAFIAAWVVSRVWGWPVGPEAGVPHAAGFVDGVTVGLEALLVVAGYELLAHPRLGDRLGPTSRVVLAAVPVGILALATAAIASPSAFDHAHGGTAAGGTQAAAGATTAAGDGHDHGHTAATPVDDKGLSLVMNGAGEGGGHVHDTSVQTLDPATQAKLDAQLAQMKPFIEKYPTVKDAEAAGYRRQGPFAPALGAHYGEPGRPFLNTGPTVTDEALKHPMLIYDGVAPDSKLAGFMYSIFSTDTEHPPEGFVGPNDHWHFHTNVCIKMRPDGGIDAPLGADASATKELCDTYGGILIKNTGYMVHVWPVPGYESSQGLFSNLNPKITCPNGTYYMVPLDQVGSRTNVCKDVAA